MVHENEEFIYEIWRQVLPTKVKRNKNSVHSLLQFEELVMAVALEVLFFSVVVPLFRSLH